MISRFNLFDLFIKVLPLDYCILAFSGPFAGRRDEVSGKLLVSFIGNGIRFLLFKCLGSSSIPVDWSLEYFIICFKMGSVQFIQLIGHLFINTV